jgi:hypothetical protein
VGCFCVVLLQLGAEEEIWGTSLHLRYGHSIRGLNARVFASKVKAELQYLAASGRRRSSVLCIGNEAGDLDTMVSALAAAYAYDQTQQGRRPRLFVPVMPMLRSQVSRAPK